MTVRCPSPDCTVEGSPDEIEAHLCGRRLDNDHQKFLCALTHEDADRIEQQWNEAGGLTR